MLPGVEPRWAFDAARARSGASRALPHEDHRRLPALLPGNRLRGARSRALRGLRHHGHWRHRVRQRRLVALRSRQRCALGGRAVGPGGERARRDPASAAPLLRVALCADEPARRADGALLRLLERGAEAAVRCPAAPLGRRPPAARARAGRRAPPRRGRPRLVRAALPAGVGAGGAVRPLPASPAGGGRRSLGLGARAGPCAAPAGQPRALPAVLRVPLPPAPPRRRRARHLAASAERSPHGNRRGTPNSSPATTPATSTPSASSRDRKTSDTSAGPPRVAAGTRPLTPSRAPAPTRR